MSASPSLSLPGATAKSRRSALLELGSVGIVLAIPIGALWFTAKPIPNPPSRETLHLLNPERMALRKQRRELANDRRSAKQRERQSKPAREARTERQESRAQRRATRS